MSPLGVVLTVPKLPRDWTDQLSARLAAPSGETTAALDSLGEAFVSVPELVDTFVEPEGDTLIASDEGLGTEEGRHSQGGLVAHLVAHLNDRKCFLNPQAVGLRDL